MAVTVRGTDILFNDGTTQSTAASAGAATPTAGNIARGFLVRSVGTNLAGANASSAIIGGFPSYRGMSNGAGEYPPWLGLQVGATYTRTFSGSYASAGSRQYYQILVGGTFRTNIVATAAWGDSYSGPVYTGMYYRLYKNGVAFGTERFINNTKNYTLWTEDLSFSAGDKIDLYIRSSGGTVYVPIHSLQLSVGNVNQLNAFELLSEGA